MAEVNRGSALSLRAVRERGAPNAIDVPGANEQALSTALAGLEGAGAARLDLPPRTYEISSAVPVDHDLHLHGAGGADWLHSDPTGTVLVAANGVSDLFRITGHPYKHPVTGEETPTTRIGAYSFEGLVHQGEGGPGARITNAAHRYEVGNGPVRPVSYDHCTFRGFKNALDVSVGAGQNTGIGQLTLSNVVFTDCDNAIRSRGNNGILQASFINVTFEQGARIDAMHSDDPAAGGPGAMGGWQFIGGQFEGQSDAIRIHGGSWQFFMSGTYFEHSTGRTLDLKASRRNSSAYLHNLHVEHAPIHVYLEGFNAAVVDTNPRGVRVHVAYNGPRSRYHGCPVIPIPDSEGACITLADAGEAGYYAGAAQPGAVYSSHDYPDTPYPLLLSTPRGRLAAQQLGVGVGGMSFATTAVAAGQTAVITALARTVAGAPALGYVLVNGNTGATLANRTDLVQLSDGWALVMLTYTPTADIPSLKWAWQVADGATGGLNAQGEWIEAPASSSTAQITEAHCAIVPNDTPVHHWLPLSERSADAVAAPPAHPEITGAAGASLPGNLGASGREWLAVTPGAAYGYSERVLTYPAGELALVEIGALSGWKLVHATWTATNTNGGHPRACGVINVLGRAYIALNPNASEALNVRVETVWAPV